MESKETASKTFPMHLAIAFDVNYFFPFSALLSSILDNHESGQIKIHAIATGITEEQKTKITRRVAQHNCLIEFYAIDESTVNAFVLIHKWTQAVYYRLLFPLIIRESIDKLIYLDADTIVLRSLNSLYQLDTDGHPIAAVYDNYVKTQPLLGIIEEGEYFNSGVMLIDIAKWREEKISEQAMEYLRLYPERIKFVDQCALNAVLKNNWKKLDFRFNVMYSYLPGAASKRELKKFLDDKIILHYTLQRPWQMLNKNRLAWLYHDHLKKSLPGREVKTYNDFEWKKIPAWLRIKSLHLYFDTPVLPALWKRIKKYF
jgi:lipopolysaccharide biosynthesis glycosyltransferase